MTMGKSIKRILTGLLLLAAAVILAFGPRPGAKRPADRVCIRYWEKWTGPEAEQMQQIVDDFNNSMGKDKGIYVEYLSMSKVDQKALVAMAAGVPPDVVGTWHNQIGQLAALDAVLPLELMAAEHGITEAGYKKVYWNGCSYKGHLWALVSTPGSMALHYNKNLFYENAEKLRTAGLDPLRAPRTIDELDLYARSLDVYGSDGKRIERAGFLPMEPGWYTEFECLWFGTEWFDPKTDKFLFTDPKMAMTYQWIQNYAKRLGPAALSEFTSSMGSFATAQNAFLTGQVAMEKQGPWMANFIQNLKPELSEVMVSKGIEPFLPRVARPFNYQWAVAPFPSAVPGLVEVAFCPFDALVIPRGSKHSREAFEFIAYVNRQDVMEKLVSLHCKNSPLAKVSEGFIRKHPNPYIDVFERLAASDNARTVPGMPIEPEVVSEVGSMAQDIILLHQTPVQALAKIQNRLTEKYDQFLQQQRRLAEK